MGEIYLKIANFIYLINSIGLFLVALILSGIFRKKIWDFRRPALILSFITFFLCTFKFLPFIFNWPGIREHLNNSSYYSYLILLIAGVPYDFIKIFTFIAAGMVLFQILEINPFKFKDNKWKGDYWLYIVLSSAIFIGISELLVYLTHPEVTEGAKSFYRIIEVFYRTKELAALSIATYAPFTEEVTYRFFFTAILLTILKNFKYRWPAAVIIASIIWSFGHGGVMEPEWVKFVQIFTYGLILGILFKKKGIEACIISHLLSNILLTVIHLNSEF